MTSKSYLVVCDRSPYGSISTRESLDMAIAAAAFDLPVQVLLRGDGVHAALASQVTEALGQKNLGKQLGALAIYGVEAVFVDGEALADRGLVPEDLVPDVTVLNESAMRTLIRDRERVIQL